MLKFFLGLILGVGLLACLQVYQSSQTGQFLGATPSRGDFIGIYNATTTDLVLRDGYGSAFAVDQHGRIITTSTAE